MHTLKQASKYLLAPIAGLMFLAPGASAETLELDIALGAVKLPTLPAVGGSWSSPAAKVSGTAGAGTSSLTCKIDKVTLPNFTSNCTWDLKLDSGDGLTGDMPTLALTGPGKFAAAPVTITGGSGKYANAKGSGTQAAADMASGKVSVTLNVD